MKKSLTIKMLLPAVLMIICTSASALDLNPGDKKIVILKKTTYVIRFHKAQVKAAPVMCMRAAPAAVALPETGQGRIDFGNLDEEMNKVQENIDQMDPVLQQADSGDRRKAEEILKTGIHAK